MNFELARSLFVGLLESLQYQATRGRIPELRERVYHVLRSCQVEMIIFDEAQRVSAQAMSEIRDISDILEIAVVLVGTDRLNAVIQRDEQVLYRFLSAYRSARLGSEELQEMTAWSMTSLDGAVVLVLVFMMHQGILSPTMIRVRLISGLGLAIQESTERDRPGVNAGERSIGTAALAGV